MALFNPNVTVESKARNTTQLPISEGQFLMTSDTKNVFYDLAGERIQLTDIIELDTEAQRKAILAPLNKFYFVKDTGILWRDNNGWPSRAVVRQAPPYTKSSPQRGGSTTSRSSASAV